MLYITRTTDGAIAQFFRFPPSPSPDGLEAIAENSPELATYLEALAILPSDPVTNYRWVDLENTLRGTDLFGVAFNNPNTLTLITHSFANTGQTDANRFADFTFAVQAIQEQYDQEQRDRFLSVLQACGFPPIAFAE
ncbi:MAG: hypothetical protein KME27_10515 [Lyngbya sp. HA4199-MV5]|jgi:hypothetical protein|nr:hypothetical protein [Lyngbya sp. HA4199-MV5]